MAYDEKLAARIRNVLVRYRAVREIKMFGGLCFTIRGNMCCGVDKTNLMVRVGPERYEKALTQPHARPMDITAVRLKDSYLLAAEGIRPIRRFGSGSNNPLFSPCPYLQSPNKETLCKKSCRACRSGSVPLPKVQGSI